MNAPNQEGKQIGLIDKQISQTKLQVFLAFQETITWRLVNCSFATYINTEDIYSRNLVFLENVSSIVFMFGILIPLSSSNFYSPEYGVGRKHGILFA